MKTSSRNSFQGKITAIILGGLNDEVELTLASGEKVYGQLAHASAERLGLAVGGEALALVKATEILLEYAQDPSETLPADEEGGSYSSEFVSFPLPVREEPYELTIYREGILVLDPTQIQPGTNKYTLELKGRGKQTFELYIDGVLYTTKTVEFGANE